MTFYLARALNAVTVIVLTTLALYISRRTQPWLCAIALLPMTVNLYGSVNQDGDAIALVLLAAAIVDRAVHEQRDATITELSGSPRRYPLCRCPNRPTPRSRPSFRSRFRCGRGAAWWPSPPCSERPSFGSPSRFSEPQATRERRGQGAQRERERENGKRRGGVERGTRDGVAGRGPGSRGRGGGEEAAHGRARTRDAGVWRLTARAELMPSPGAALALGMAGGGASSARRRGSRPRSPRRTRRDAPNARLPLLPHSRLIAPAAPSGDSPAAREPPIPPSPCLGPAN